MIHVGVAEYIGSAVEGLAYSEPEGGNVFVDFMPSTPDRAVCVYVGPGYEADSKLPYDPFQIQVVARGEAGGAWAVAAWERVYSVLHGLRNTTLPDGTRLAFLLATQSSPFRLGPDPSGRPQYSMNLRGEAINPTNERTE